MSLSLLLKTNYIMIVYPNAKINLGLNILRKRPDGYHDISSVFYPVHECTDILEIVRSNEFNLTITGIDISEHNNSCVKAWELLDKEFNIGGVHIHLLKRIPIGSGLGGGSSDASFTLKALNQIFRLSLSIKELESYAIQIGSDCPFFIDNKPKLVTGRGEKMVDIDIDLSDFIIHLKHSPLHISTRDAYNHIVPKLSSIQLENILQEDVKYWKDNVKNDFEEIILNRYPELKEVRKELYQQGSLYVSLTGTGSTIYALNKKE